MTLGEIRQLLIDQGHRDIYQPHPLYQDITTLILNHTHTDDVEYANLLEDILAFCEDQLESIGFRDINEQTQD